MSPIPNYTRTLKSCLNNSIFVALCSYQVSTCHFIKDFICDHTVHFNIYTAFISESQFLKWMVITIICGYESIETYDKNYFFIITWHIVVDMVKETMEFGVKLAEWSKHSVSLIIWFFSPSISDILQWQSFSKLLLQAFCWSRKIATANFGWI